MRCIDAHLHIFEHLNGYAFLGEFRPLGNGKCRWAGGPADLICTPDMGDRGVSAESMIGFMDRNEIEMGVLLQGTAYGFHNEFVAEFVPKGFNKGTGMRKVCEMLGIDIADTFAFGDSVNDREMILTAGTGVVMGNGAPAMKEIADYVTLPMMEGGIHHACREFGLI